MAHEALLYEKLPESKVKCRLCAHGCLINQGSQGLCGVRENRQGTLYTLNWGRPVSLAVDPIEKKPLFHFLPGSLSFSLAALGCNFQCPFCQNWQLSQMTPESLKWHIDPVLPQDVARMAISNNCVSISYTYTEPTIYFEYAYDCMKPALEAGLRNVFVSNGYQSPDCLEACRGYLHAANVDLKSFRDEFYKNECRASLAPVLNSLKIMRSYGIWLEITTLVIPGKNDDPAELKDLADFIVKELSPDVPWHVSAYRPQYKYAGQGPGSTPPKTLLKAHDIGLKSGLNHVYVGNAPGLGSEDTICPQCDAVLLRRKGFKVLEMNLKKGACPSCARPLPGVWQ